MDLNPLEFDRPRCANSWLAAMPLDGGLAVARRVPAEVVLAIAAGQSQPNSISLADALPGRPPQREPEHRAAPRVGFGP